MFNRYYYLHYDSLNSWVKFQNHRNPLKSLPKSRIFIFIVVLNNLGADFKLIFSFIRTPQGKSSTQLLYNYFCLSVCSYIRQPCLGKNAIFSAPIWDRAPIFLCTILTHMSIYYKYILSVGQATKCKNVKTWKFDFSTPISVFL